MDQKDTTRERRERQAAATAAYEALSVLRSKTARAAHELRTAVIEDATVPALRTPVRQECPFFRDRIQRVRP